MSVQMHQSTLHKFHSKVRWKGRYLTQITKYKNHSNERLSKYFRLKNVEVEDERGGSNCVRSFRLKGQCLSWIKARIWLDHTVIASLKDNVVRESDMQDVSSW